MQDYFRQFQQIAETSAYHVLDNLRVPRPEFFNWTTEVFEGLHLAGHPNKTALILADDSATQEISYQQLADRANRLLNYWRAADVEPGQAVLLMVPVCAELWDTYVAGIKGGQIIIPTATIMTVKDLEYRFGRLLPAGVIADAENAAKIDEAEQAGGHTIRLKMLVDTAAGSTRPGWVSFAETAAQPTQAPAARTRADDPLFLFFTSGTTGLPKVVTHTHFSYPVGHLSTAAWIGIRPGDVHCNISQAGWAKFAWSSFFAPLNVGATLFVFQAAGRFAAPPLLAALARHRVSTFCAPPTVLRLLILEDLTQYQFAFRECVSAGEPLNPEVIEAWQRGTGRLIRDGYGQTESTALIYNLPTAEVRLGSMGRPSFMYDMAIADDDGNLLPDLAEGHITVRTDTGRPNGLFKEYFGEPERRAAVFRHGLYYTGDKAYRDADGYYWFVGRDDDVIKSSDYRVGPFEVESALVEHPAVVESAVVGSPHPIKGHEIKAFVILHPDHPATPALARELFAYCRQHLAPYKMPRILEFVAELPKTISGKIRRVELRAREEQQRRGGTQGEQEHFYQARS
jgi:acyl-coenzyme A synthetase/AMP-(fatty) acid ligase